MDQMDIIIEDGLILTMDEDGTIHENGMIAIKDSRIVYVGPGISGKYTAGKIINARDCIVMPGIVNCHTHAPMSLFKGIADDRPLMEWLENYIFPVERNMDEEFIYTGTLLACAEMILSGTTTFCDMYLFEEHVARAVKISGMRALVGEVLYDFDSPNYGPLDKGFEYTVNLIERWRDDPLVSIAVEPHATFTCSPELLKRAHSIAVEYNVPVVIHLSETRNEVEQIKERYGMRPAEFLDSLGLLYPGLITVHCVHLNQNEMELLSKNGVKAVAVPESNLKLGSGIAPVTEMLKAGITVGLGTDGSASNNNLDMFCEMDTGSKSQKIKTMDPSVMDAETAVKMATIYGARVLGMERDVGSIEKGKKADIIVIDTRRPHLVPMYNPYSHLVYSATGSDVIHSIINGRLVMENREILTLDLDEIIEMANREAERVKKWTNMKKDGSSPK